MDQPTDNAAYLRKWASDIRASSGPSVDADRLDAIAAELERTRRERDEARAALRDLARELATHVVWSRRGDDGNRAYECDICDARDEDADDLTSMQHIGGCMLARAAELVGEDAQ